MFCCSLAKTMQSLPNYSQNTASRQLQTVSLIVCPTFLMFILVIQKSCRIDSFGGNRRFFNRILYLHGSIEAEPSNRVPF